MRFVFYPGSVAFAHQALLVGIGAVSARDCITMPLERDQDTSRRPQDESGCFPSCLHTHANSPGRVRHKIVTAARIAVQPPHDARSDLPSPIYAGQPIPATLVLKTSFHWAEKEGKQPSYEMRYDVEERVKDWLLCGRKRGDFVATVGAAGNSFSW